MPFPNNLPQPLASFIGREQEIAEVKRLLTVTRLLILTGMGGAGKTRLSLKVASDLVDDYPGGIWFVDLAQLEDPTLLPQAVASTLGIREESGRPLLEILSSAIGSSPILVLLDNCEHLVEACASLADTLLRACPNLRILATSRHVLGVPGEVAWPVPPLSLPNPKENLPIERMLQCDAIQLFVGRALLRRLDFALTPANAQAVAQLCFQLEGIPLAIELAAARINVLSVEEIVNRLDQRFRLLSSRTQGTPNRHQTLTALMDWSYDLLSDSERLLFRSLAVFAGGFTRQAVETVCAGEIDEYEIIELLSQLVDKSLVIMHEVKGKSRYRMLETVRQYAWDKGTIDDGRWTIDNAQRQGLYPSQVHIPSATLRESHMLYFLQLVEEAEPHLMGADQDEWLQRLEEEHDNMRVALTWARENGEKMAGLRMAGALWRFWRVRGYYSEGREQLTNMLSLADEGRRTNDKTSSIVLRPASDDGNTVYAKALLGAGSMALEQGDYRAATPLFEKSLALYRDLGDRQAIGLLLNILGIVAWNQEDVDHAQAFYEESLAIRRELGDDQGIASSLSNLGNIAWGQGDYSRASSLYRESFDIQQKLGNKWGMAMSLGNLGLVAHDEGDYSNARRLHKESLAIRQELGDKIGTAWCLENLARAAAAERKVAYAARLWGAAEALREAVGAPLPPADRTGYERDVAAARALCGEDAFAKAWAEGRATPSEEAIDLSYEDSADLDPLKTDIRDKPQAEALPTLPYPNELTRREVEVLLLIAEGLTNPEIAQQLSLSVHTVEAHLRSIYSKIGVTTRNAATHYAHRSKIS